MGIVTLNAKTITGSVSNNLGTLGKSLFNSTIGTYADSNTMDQLYNAMEKLNSSIETIDKTYDTEAVTGRNKADDLYSLLAGLDIKSSSDFMNKNRELMKRLMRLNKQEKDITLNALGVDTTGKSHVIKNEYVQDYEYVKGNNYLEDYVIPLSRNQEIGDETTTMQLASSNHYNYSGKHNDLYTVGQNLYPDEDNSGSFSNKWIVENRNSLMYKTKKLFNSKKIGTIISRFHTDATTPTSTTDNAKSKYGLSHGRNLLTKKAEKGYSGSYNNGYDNPYCRVWTHHHQYDRYYKTIRPFSSIDDNGNYDSTISVEDFHKWSQFQSANGKEASEWGWKKMANSGWQHSVLRDNGKVNITPKYIHGGASNIHTKQCMFSIENLAWRGYDPYSFEQALSWEQRGPLGGRIMWFPPYGITFNETTSTQWANTTFLGRGEDVYTYKNTTRTGSLSFMMVVDHPSIIDYITWSDANKTVTDTDVLRFMAGCGEGDGKGFRDLAKPTLLTDEYTQVHVSIEPQVRPEIIKVEDDEEEEIYVMEEEKKVLPDGFSFYVFYPNNYSGTYDDEKGEGYDIDKKSKVDPILYLLMGKGAQQICKSGDNTIQDIVGEDIPLNKKNVGNANTGNGYEMNGNGVGNLKSENNFIRGTSAYNNKIAENSTELWANLGPREITYKTGKELRKWCYRIDGRYVCPKDNEKKMNYYNQSLDAASYIDNNSFRLNKDIAKVASAIGLTIETEDDVPYLNDEGMPIFTLEEVARVIYKDYEFAEKKLNPEYEERIELLEEMLEEKTIESVTSGGFASSHGYLEINKTLAKHRAQTAGNWFAKEKGVGNKLVEEGILNQSALRGGNPLPIRGDESGWEAKKERYAKVTVKFKTSGATTPSTSNTTQSDNTKAKSKSGNIYGDEQPSNSSSNKGEVRYVGYYPTNEEGLYKGEKCKIYIDTKTKKKWYKIPGASPTKFVSVGYAKEEDSVPKERASAKDNSGDMNRVRYDQEYHFFKVLEQKDPVVFGSLMDKLQYFDPAFHSMTPEGFNGRLTFLQQCMRQGNTVSASDGKFAKSANNLAFGRAPYCVLRLGDFYNQMIVIDNLTINYDPLVWDLNVEGAGVQPLIANVQLSFKFVGGGDMTGPIRRLQNAMSFNYYSNARLYDNRADRVERKWSDKTCGAIEHDEIIGNEKYSKKFKKTYNISDNSSSKFYTTDIYE